jgi:hypothetical protein
MELVDSIGKPIAAPVLVLAALCRETRMYVAFLGHRTFFSTKNNVFCKRLDMEFLKIGHKT